MTSFEIKYETAASIPPPYCYYYHIKCAITKTGIATDLEWTYHNREEMTQEEIEDEGFTGQDDYSWKGEISNVWIALMEQHLQKTRLSHKPEDKEQPYLELNFQDQKGVIFQGKPDNLLEWDYFLQEFIQSIYETSGKEAPLLIRYKKITADTTLYCSIKMQFKDRTVSIQTRQGETKMVQKQSDWNEMKQVLELIFSLSYIADKAEKRESHLQGTYIDIGENLWYEFGKTVINPSLKINTLAQVEKSLEKIIKRK